MSFTQEELQHDIENMSTEDFTAKYSGSEFIGLDEAKASSPIAGTRLISKHEGTDGHHAEVRYNPDWEEYQTHHYRHGKHLGEGPVSYHGSGKEGKADATDAAKFEIARRSKMTNEEVELGEDKVRVGTLAQRTQAYRDDKANELKGNQHKIDKIDAQDFKLLKKKKVAEEVEELSELSPEIKASYAENGLASYNDQIKGARKGFKKAETLRDNGFTKMADKEVADSMEKSKKAAKRKEYVDKADPSKAEVREETQRMTPDSVYSRNKAVENTIMEIMAQNRDLRQEAKIDAFKKNQHK
jgi:hypothetical protein